MRDEQVRPLTAEEIEAIRGRLETHTWPHALLYRELGALLATLDAWRPVVEAMTRHYGAVAEDGRGSACVHCGEEGEGPAFSIPHAPDCPVLLAQRLLGRES